MNFKEKMKLPNGTVVTRAKDLILVVLAQGKSFEDKEIKRSLKEFKTYSFKTEESEDSQLYPQTINQSDTHRFFIHKKGAFNQGSELQKSMGADACISGVYFSQKDDLHSYFSVLANALVIQPEMTTEPKKIEALCEKYKLRMNQAKSKYLSGKYYVVIQGYKRSVSEIRSRLLKSRAIHEVFFEQVPMISPTCAVPNDPLFPNQWNLEKIEWHLDYIGCNKTDAVAIIDQGCDLNHPDLNFASPGINLGTMLPDGSPTGNHGTPCAGVAAAIAANGMGPAGVAGATKILPLAVSLWSDVEISSGINYATTFGAAVISMSFGTFSNVWNFTLIDSEIVFATNHAVFLCAASGNENNAFNNRYPGRHPLVLCIGGSNKQDLRKSIGDPLQPGWGSNYGLEYYQGILVGVDVVAPCLEIPTTDILGTSGNSIYDYQNFNGTSAATPHVAGLVALIKSILPHAGNSQVKKIIEASADKIGGYTYTHEPHFPNSSWTQEVGHGRINVRKAVELARQWACYQPCCEETSANPVAFSVSGRTHVSAGGDVQLIFRNVTLNSGSGWQNDHFTAPEDGLYYFDWNFVKDAYYYRGTQDDVSIYLRINNSRTAGLAWSGEGDGRRGTGASSKVLALRKHDKVKAMVHSDGGRRRHLARFDLNGFKLS